MGQDLALFMGISPETGNIFLSTSSFAEDYPMLRYMAIPWLRGQLVLNLHSTQLLHIYYEIEEKLVFSKFLLSAISNILTTPWGLMTVIGALDFFRPF